MSSCGINVPALTEQTADAFVEDDAEVRLSIGQQDVPRVRLLEIPRMSDSTCGFHLTRSKWDPYPWISAVDADSPAQQSGLQAGDCVLEVNGEDVLGMRIAAVAKLAAEQENHVSLLLWSSGQFAQKDPETLCNGPMPITLQRLSASVAAILSAIECPVCLDTISPPALQCVHGHLVCLRCRQRSERCPVCRERFGKGRSLLADQVFNALTDAFELRVGSDELPPGKIRERLFGPNKKTSKTHEGTLKPQTVSHAHKFLAKIMGKSCSAENLSSNKLDDRTTLSVSNEDFSTLKAKSLSTNGLFSTISIPRCPSASRLDWTGSNESARYLGYDLVGSFGSRRPVSRATSAECLADTRHDEEISIRVPDVPQSSNKVDVYRCPYAESCTELIQGKQMSHHISVKHGPLIVWDSVAEFCLPPADIMTTAHLVMNCLGQTFHLKIEFSNANEVANSSIGDMLMWCWIQGPSKTAERFLVQVQIKGEKRNLDDDIKDVIERTGMIPMIGKDVCARSEVYSLKDIHWQDIKESRRGIFFTKSTLTANFGKVKSLNLRIEILPVD